MQRELAHFREWRSQPILREQQRKGCDVSASGAMASTEMAKKHGQQTGDDGNVLIMGSLRARIASNSKQPATAALLSRGNESCSLVQRCHRKSLGCRPRKTTLRHCDIHRPEPAAEAGERGWGSGERRKDGSAPAARLWPRKPTKANCRHFATVRGPPAPPCSETTSSHVRCEPQRSAGPISAEIINVGQTWPLRTMAIVRAIGRYSSIAAARNTDNSTLLMFRSHPIAASPEKLANKSRRCRPLCIALHRVFVDCTVPSRGSSLQNTDVVPAILCFFPLVAPVLCVPIARMEQLAHTHTHACSHMVARTHAHTTLQLLHGQRDQ